MSEYERVVTFLEQHVRKLAIIYVMISYLAFASINLAYLKMDDPYGSAMVCIGSFWLALRWLLGQIKQRGFK